MSNEQTYYDAKRRFHESNETFGEKELDIIDDLGGTTYDYEDPPVVLVCHIDSEVYMQCIRECDDADWDGERYHYYYCYRALVHGPVQQKD